MVFEAAKEEGKETGFLAYKSRDFEGRVIQTKNEVFVSY
jgi:hypothetical protein